MRASQSRDFAGTARFEIIRKLGVGGMGVVYEARDTVRGERIALKTLNRLDPELLYSLKSEFRILQHLYHPNLIRFGQLFEDAGSWFFTMEMVDGTDFLSYVYRRDHEPLDSTLNAVAGDDATLKLSELPPQQSRSSGGGPVLTPPPEVGVFDEKRLRVALEGVVSGLHALHQTGVVHCDVKPGNIMITERGRVVLLDFGLAQDSSGHSREGLILGTPGYMAPEQADGKKATAASDWYAVGASLFQALTGRLPFTGNPTSVLEQKRTVAPPRPSSIEPRTPKDLDALCVHLLATAPADRPTGSELLERVSRSKPVSAIGRPTSTAETPFVGRQRELAMLESAFDAVRPNAPIVVQVQASSGMGKTALIEHFLQGLENRPDSIVLRGRCLERASVPYKGLDHLIDSLSWYLNGLSSTEVRALLPENTFELLDVFPVLRQVRGVPRRSRLDGHASPDPRERQSLAFAGLRDLLAAIAERKRLVLFVDDLQWSDVDSALLLSTLLRGPSAPAILLIESYRSDDLDDQTIQPLVSGRGADVDTRRMVLDPLSIEDTRSLAVALFSSGARNEEMIARVTREVGGSPLLLAEIAHHVEPEGASSEDSALDISLDDIIRRRLERLPEDARTLLHTIAVVGRPVDPELVIRASNITGGERAMQLLASTYMITQHGRDRETVEVFHQRLKNRVLGTLSEDAQIEIQRRIVSVLADGDWDDGELLELDLAIATNSPRTLDLLLEAAQQAERCLAFERAAQLYRQALDLCSPEQKPNMRRSLADILCLAGHGSEAATEYLQLAEHESDLSRTDLVRRAADNLLWTGHIEDGLRHLDQVMRDLGIRLPATRTGAIASLLYKRMRLALHRGQYGSSVDDGDAGAASPKALRKLDTMYAATTSLGMIDHLRGSVLQSQCLLWALRAGDEWRICRALVAEIGYLAVQGGDGLKAAEKMGRDVLLRAERQGDNFLLGGVRVSIGIAHFFAGRFPAARAMLAEACTYLKRESSAWWELHTAQFFHCLAQLNEGDFLSYAPSVRRILHRAERRNDAYMHYLFSGHPSIWCAMRDDDVGPAQEQLRTVLDTWPAGVNYQAHYSVMAGTAMSLLYVGNAEKAADLLNSSKKMLRDLMVHRMPFIQGEVDKLRGRAAILLGDDKTAFACGKKLLASNLPIARAMGSVLLAPLAQRDGDTDRAQTLLVEATELYEQCGAKHCVRACHFQLGKIIGGSRGDELSSDALEWMRGQGVVAPERMIEFLSPGF